MVGNKIIKQNEINIISNVDWQPTNQIVEHIAAVKDEMEIDSDDTNRVFYVGATRAKQSLHIVQPQRERGFII